MIAKLRKAFVVPTCCMNGGARGQVEHLVGKPRYLVKHQEDATRAVIRRCEGNRLVRLRWPPVQGPRQRSQAWKRRKSTDQHVPLSPVSQSGIAGAIWQPARNRLQEIVFRKMQKVLRHLTNHQIGQ